jgi:hypothetical protein
MISYHRVGLREQKHLALQRQNILCTGDLDTLRDGLLHHVFVYASLD